MARCCRVQNKLILSRLLPASHLDSEKESEEEKEKEAWDAARMNLVKCEILEVHKNSRTAHCSAGPDDDNWDEHKYRVLVRHLETRYGDTTGQIPPVPEQVDELITAVVNDCPPCSRLRASKRAEKLADDRAKATKKRDWKMRYDHRLHEDEYDTDSDHKPDSKCGKCNHPGGRRGKSGKSGVFGDADDRDQLRNCEGLGCTKAFHLDCRGLEQDTPDNRRQHNMDPAIQLTFARRAEPWLCAGCWFTAGHKQLKHDQDLLAEQQRKFAEKSKRARTTSSGGAAAAPSDSTAVNAHYYDALALPGAACEMLSSSSAAEDEGGNFPPTKSGGSFLEILRTAMEKRLPVLNLVPIGRIHETRL